MLINVKIANEGFLLEYKLIIQIYEHIRKPSVLKYSEKIIFNIKRQNGMFDSITDECQLAFKMQDCLSRMIRIRVDSFQTKFKELSLHPEDKLKINFLQNETMMLISSKRGHQAEDNFCEVLFIAEYILKVLIGDWRSFHILVSSND